MGSALGASLWSLCARPKNSHGSDDFLQRERFSAASDERIMLMLVAVLGVWMGGPSQQSFSTQAGPGFFLGPEKQQAGRFRLQGCRPAGAQRTRNGSRDPQAQVVPTPEVGPHCYQVAPPVGPKEK